MGILAFGLMYAYFTSTLPLSRQYGLLVLAGIGCGLCLQSPLLIIQATMPMKEMAAVTAAWTLTRSLGGSVGVSVYTAILNTNLRHRFAQIPGDGTEFSVPTSAAGYQAIHNMPESPLKRQILDAFADSFKPTWIVAACLFAACLIVTIPTRAYSLNRPRGPPPAKPDEAAPGEGEKAAVEDGKTSSSSEKMPSAQDTPSTTVAEFPEKVSGEVREDEKIVLK
jgi:hypothetical protein